MSTKKFQNIMVLKKTEYPENRGTSEAFFPDSLLKLNSLQVHVKKSNFWTTKICHVPKLINNNK